MKILKVTEREVVGSENLHVCVCVCKEKREKKNKGSKRILSLHISHHLEKEATVDGLVKDSSCVMSIVLVRAVNN